MKFKTLINASLCLSFLLMAGVASAETLYFRFEGNVSQYNYRNDLFVDIGCDAVLPTRIKGCYSVESDATDQDASPMQGKYEADQDSFWLEFSNCHFELEPDQVYASLFVYIWDDYVFPPYLIDPLDAHDVEGNSYTSSHGEIDWWYFFLAGMAPSPLGWYTSDALPTTPPDFSLAETIYFEWAGMYYEFPYGRIDLQADLDTYEATSSCLTAEEALTGLVADIIALNLQTGLANSLDAKLAAIFDALADLNENNNTSVVNRLNAFMNEVEAQRGKKITDAQADELIEAALEIIDLL